MDGEQGSARQFRWIRAVSIAISILFFCYAAYGIWLKRTDPAGIDFVSFWAAGHLTLNHQPWAAYDIVTHRALEKTVSQMTGLMPFPYPPPFLLFVTPFALLPVWASCAAWIAATAAIYFAAFRRIAPWPFTFAHAANFSNALIGQNGMLTSAMFAGGFELLERRPWLAGAILGLLVIKPQLAVLIPVALLAGRQWTAIMGAALSSLGLLAFAFLIFGEETYRAFFAIIGPQASLVDGRIPWQKIASLFGALRTMGVPATPALAIHAAVAVAAGAATWLAWSRRLSTRIPIVAAASLLVSPYLFNHDSLLLMIPIGWLIVQQRRPWTVVLLWGISVLAVTGIGPNPTPLAAIIAIAVMWREAVQPTVSAAASPEAA